MRDVVEHGARTLLVVKQDGGQYHAIGIQCSRLERATTGHTAGDRRRTIDALTALAWRSGNGVAIEVEHARDRLAGYGSAFHDRGEICARAGYVHTTQDKVGRSSSRHKHSTEGDVGQEVAIEQH